MQAFDESRATSEAPGPPPITLFERHRGRLRGAPQKNGTNEGRVEVLLVFAGAGALRKDGEVQPLQPGDLILNPGSLVFSLDDSKGAPLGLYSLQIARAALSRAQMNPQRLPQGRFPLNDSALESVNLSLRRMLFLQSRAGDQSSQQLEALAVDLIRGLTPLAYGQLPFAEQDSRPSSSSVAGLERMREYVRALEHSFFEATTIDAAAQSLVLSRRRFTQLFREVTQTTWLTYLRQLRIAHARNLLSQTRRTVNSVAFECGFEDISTFYRAFKRESRTSPNRWRQEQAAG